LAFYLDAMRIFKGAQDAYDFIQLPRHKGNESPLLLIVRHRILSELGKESEIQELESRMMVLYPLNQMVRLQVGR